VAVAQWGRRGRRRVEHDVRMATPAVVLSIGAADPTAAQGIQADLKTFAAHRL